LPDINLGIFSHRVLFLKKVLGLDNVNLSPPCLIYENKNHNLNLFYWAFMIDTNIYTKCSIPLVEVSYLYIKMYRGKIECTFCSVSLKFFSRKLKKLLHTKMMMLKNLIPFGSDEKFDTLLTSLFFHTFFFLSPVFFLPFFLE
jgi:hypothetical protein